MLSLVEKNSAVGGVSLNPKEIMKIAEIFDGEVGLKKRDEVGHRCSVTRGDQDVVNINQNVDENGIAVINEERGIILRSA